MSPAVTAASLGSTRVALGRHMRMAKVLAWPPTQLLWEACRTFHPTSRCGHASSNHSGFAAKRLAALSATASAACLAPISTAFCVALASAGASSSPMQEPKTGTCKQLLLFLCRCATVSEPSSPQRNARSALWDLRASERQVWKAAQNPEAPPTPGA